MSAGADENFPNPKRRGVPKAAARDRLSFTARSLPTSTLKHGSPFASGKARP